MMMSSCSNGHNSRTCLPSAADNSSSVVADGGGGGSGEIVLFGVRVMVDPMRKSVSMNNLSQYEEPQELSNNAADISAAVPTGYASADDAANHHSTASRERKRGVPWTEEEHKLFLLGLQKVGKGDWRGISRNFVKTRTPTQVASHAQKYFLRRSNLNRRRRRSSLFDITTDSVIATPVEEELVHEDNLICPVIQQQETPNSSGFWVPPFPATVGPVLFPMEIENPLENLTRLGNADQLNNASRVLIHPIPVLPIPNPPPPRAEVNLSQKLTIENSPLYLNLSLSFNHQNQSSSTHSAFQVMPSFKNGDSMISVV